MCYYVATDFTMLYRDFYFVLLQLIINVSTDFIFIYQNSTHTVSNIPFAHKLFLFLLFECYLSIFQLTNVIIWCWKRFKFNPQTEIMLFISINGTKSSKKYKTKQNTTKENRNVEKKGICQK